MSVYYQLLLIHIYEILLILRNLMIINTRYFKKRKIITHQLLFLGGWQILLLFIFKRIWLSQRFEGYISLCFINIFKGVMSNVCSPSQLSVPFFNYSKKEYCICMNILLSLGHFIVNVSIVKRGLLIHVLDVIIATPATPKLKE